MRITYIMAIALLAGTGASFAEQKPRWMSPEAGWVDEATDTRVEKVTKDPEKGYRVEISIPKVDRPIEEVLVVGQKQEKPELPNLMSYEVINDLDSGRSGIILYMGEKKDFALQINYSEGIPQGKAKDPGLTTR